MSKCALYRVVHKDSGKDYVGISCRPERRWKTHQRLAASGSQYHFHNALRLYGPEQFTWKVVAWCSSFTGAQTLERMARHLGMGAYNMTLGGEGRKAPCTEEHKQRISEAKRGRKSYTMTEDIRANMSAAAKGRVITQEQREKLSLAAKCSPKAIAQRARLHGRVR